MNFGTLIGQKKQIGQLLSNRNRVPHAILISGPEGSGKLPFALACIKWIFCTGSKENDSCGECTNCRKVENFIHPDFHTSFPVFGSKVLPSMFYKEWKEAVIRNPYLNIEEWRQVLNEPTKNPNISVDATKAILKSLQLQSYEKGAKVHLIWLAEYLGKEGNRLLKLIEEPPDNAFLILVAEKLDRVLPTIQSRCQSIILNPLDENDLAGALEKNFGLPSEEAVKVASWADGNINKALFLASEGGRQVSERWLEWMRLVFQSKEELLVKWINERSREGSAQIVAILQYGTYFLRQVLISKGAKVENNADDDNVKKSALRMAKFLSVDGISKLAEMINKAVYYVDRNANQKILLMDFSLQMGKILTSDFEENKNK